MKRLQSHLGGRFVDGGEALSVLKNPATEESVAEIASSGVAMEAALAYARDLGGPALRSLTFAERGQLLQAMASTIHEHRDELIGLALQNGGNTRSDAKFDIDGAAGTLGFYAELGSSLGEVRVLRDGEGVPLLRSPRFAGQHIQVPRHGVAVHVNAFNFPAWGTAEKAACAILAGMPVLSKPASATAWAAQRIAELWAEKQLLPGGAFQLLLGPVGDLFDHLRGQDVLAFTGSGATGARLRGHPRVVAENLRVNLEADSLNSAVLGPDVEAGSATYALCVKDIVRDMIQKTGQKCTAIRRVFVPGGLLARLRDDVRERLAAVKVGNPARDEVSMGPLATAEQLRDVRAGLAKLRAESEAVFGGDGAVTPIGTDRGYFLGPVLLENARPEAAVATHQHEVFGPVSTLMSYNGKAETAIRLVARGGGGLVASVYSDDRAFLGELVPGLAAHQGRLFLGSAKIADKSPGPGTVLPALVHGGPGRAGGGEELGGVRGMALYLQRTALEGDQTLLSALTGK
jgi:oxepin-CoA hydrolase/3-oxo-5,6-dehydrosuberyl-CoA semialdehyde dehydrogenase